jgi:hypothetical protein
MPPGGKMGEWSTTLTLSSVRAISLTMKTNYFNKL